MITTTRYEGTFTGAPESAGRARRGVRECLAGCPAAADAVLIVSELAANAVLHSASRGRSFTVRCEVFRDYVWVEVEDLGGPWHCRQRDGRPHGLDIITALAGDNWGAEPTTDGHRITWARVEFR